MTPHEQAIEAVARALHKFGIEVLTDYDVAPDVPRNDPDFSDACAGTAAALVAQIVTLLTADLQARLDAAEARERQAVEALRWAHDTLYEINPSNYDHDEVCRLNDASVEVILGLAPMLGETHGKSAEWWAEQVAAALHTGAKP